MSAAPSTWPRNLRELAALWPCRQESAVDDPIRLSDDAAAERGFVLAVARGLAQGDPVSALETVLQARRRFPVLPVSLLVLLLDLRRALGQEHRIPGDYLDYGCLAVDAGLSDRGCEAIGTGFVEDADRYLTLIYDRPSLLRATERYEQTALRLAPQAPALLSRSDIGCLRIGMMVANLVDDTVAYAKRVMDFARFLDPDRFELKVYSTENMTLRAHELPVRCCAQPSKRWAPRYLAELRERGVPVFLAPRDRPITQTALLLAWQMARDGLDALVMQSGPTMPIDWLAMRLAPTAVKLHIHIGAPNYMRGLDATLFDNAVNLERERAGWPAYAGELMLIRQGTDIGALDAQPPARRAEYGLPENAVLIGVLSNHLDRRLSEDYLAVLAGVLEGHPDAWLVPVGQRELPAAAGRFFAERGLMGRVRHLPVQRAPGSVLKMLDIYANEFPVGGSQAVVEAMACRLPVAALRGGDTHVESAGADIVGPDYAIPSRDVAAYAGLLSRWIGDRVERERVGAALRARCEQLFSIRDYVRRVGDLALAIQQRKSDVRDYRGV